MEALPAPTTLVCFPSGFPVEALQTRKTLPAPFVEFAMMAKDVKGSSLPVSALGLWVLYTGAA